MHFHTNPLIQYQFERNNSQIRSTPLYSKLLRVKAKNVTSQASITLQKILYYRIDLIGAGNLRPIIGPSYQGLVHYGTQH